MARYQVKPREDGRGPYRWSHVVKRHNALRQGTIYTQLGDELDAQDAAQLQTPVSYTHLTLPTTPYV